MDLRAAADHRVPRRRIGLVAHDHRKRDMLEWSKFNADTLRGHHLVATGTTGSMLRDNLDLDVELLASGPLGGDLQIGARIVDGDIDLLVFFWDPLQPQPHDPDVKALLRICVLRDVPTACNRATADYLISSPMFAEPDLDPDVVDPELLPVASAP